MNISRWPPNLLKFHLLTHGCQLDVIKASNYSFLGKQNSNIRNRNVLLNKLGQVRSIWKMLKLTHQTFMKSYIVIIIPKSYEVLTTSNIRSSWGQFNNCSKSFIWPLGR